jgi:hypothetical protein
MKTLKTYKKFLNEGLLDQIIGIGTGEETPSAEPVSQEKEVTTNQLIEFIAKKIGDLNDSPIYVFNQLDMMQDLYISVELFNEAKRFGFDQEKQGTLYTTAGRYSYSVLDCSIMQTFDIERIKSDLYNILKKNAGGGIKTIIEFANISALLKDQISNICNIISARQILDYQLKSGDFFIMSDNSSNKAGGNDFSESIPSFFPKIQVEKFKHTFSESSKAPK